VPHLEAGQQQETKGQQTGVGEPHASRGPSLFTLLLLYWVLLYSFPMPRALAAVEHPKLL
jgi:hypothetical protein